METQVFHTGGATVTAGINPMAGHLRCDSKRDYELVARHLVGWRQDAALTAAFARQLEHIFAKTYAAEYAQYRAHEFFPTSTEVDPGALSFTYRMSNRVGQAAVINAGNAKDLPNIGLAAQEWQSPIITLGASYNFTVVNQASALMAQFPLEAEKARATRESVEGLEEQIYAQGYAPAGVPGVTNATGVVATTQVSTGTWTAQLLTGLAAAPLSSAEISAIASDLIAAKQRIFSNSLGRHQATNVLLPPNLYSALDTAPQSPLYNGKTLLSWLEELIGMDIDFWPILLNAGSILGSPVTFGPVTGGNPQQYTRVVVYEKNPDVVQLIQAQSFIQLAPQPVGLVLEVNCYSRIGGAMMVRPVGLTYIDGL
jgi:hypothetical protein